MKRYLPVIIILALTGCTAAQEAAVTAGAQKRMQFNDSKARVLMLSLCDMSVGSYNRALGQGQRDAVATLCGGQRAVTAQDIVTLRGLMDALRKTE